MQVVNLIKKFKFEAAHRLPNVPEGHKCKNLHGHSFKFEVEVKGEVDMAQCWYMDYTDIKKVAKPIADFLDHKYLNDIPGLEAGTSEILSKWIWDKLIKDLPGLYRISVYETVSSCCHYYGEES
jgi:6-pyruvoyltetrahydropterin/6-carboxytetrahydropterin synthase